MTRNKDSRLVVRRTRTGEVLADWEASEAVHARFNRDGTHLAVLSDTSTLPYTEEEHHALVREIATGRTIARAPYRGGMQGFALSPDARYVAFSRYDVLRLWDITMAEEALQLSHEGSVNTFDFAPDAGSVAVATSQGFYLWSIPDGREVLHEAGGDSLDVAFVADGRLVAFAAADRSVRIHDASTGEELGRLVAHDVVQRLEFSPVGGVLATAGQDGTVTVWDLADLRETVRIDPEGEFELIPGLQRGGRAPSHVRTGRAGSMGNRDRTRGGEDSRGPDAQPAE